MKDELLALKRIERELPKASDDLLARAAEIATEARLNALLPAIGEGVLDLNPLGAGEGDTDVMVECMSELIQDIVAPASTTLAMFDSGSGGLLRAMVNEGAIPDARLAPATQADDASRFIAWVPAFPDAALDAILGARMSLRAPLVRYRSAIVRITRDLEATPIDDECDGAVHALHREHVEPALLEIDELTQELGLRASITSAARAGARRRVAEAAVSFAAADIAGLPPVLLSALGVSADIAAQVVRERHDAKRGQRENQFLSCTRQTGLWPSLRPARSISPGPDLQWVYEPSIQLSNLEDSHQRCHPCSPRRERFSDTAPRPLAEAFEFRLRRNSCACGASVMVGLRRAADDHCASTSPAVRWG